MLGKLIAVVHLFIAFFYSFYAFIISKNFFYDYLYFTALVILQALWILFKGECIFSYYYKLYHYENYECGDTTTMDDFNELDFFSKEGENKNKNSSLTDLVNALFCIGIILSICITTIRSRIVNPVIAVFVLIFLRFFYLFFNNATGYDTNSIGKSMLGENYKVLETIYYEYNFDKMHDVINNSILTILILFWMYMTYINRNRLKFE